MSGVTTLDAAGEKYIAGWEGGQSSDGLYRAYWDSYGGCWTIGIGETAGVHSGMVWTPAQAWADLRRRFADSYGPAINALGIRLNQNQFNAIADACWNLGTGCLDWNFGQYLRRGEFVAAGDALLAYCTAGGVRLDDLVRRRESERALLLTPEPLPVDPHHYQDYPTDVLQCEGVKFDERRLAQRIDMELKHPRVHRRQLRVDLKLARAAKTRIWIVSVHEPPDFTRRRSTPDWSDNRGPRYQWWAERITKIERSI